MTEVVSNPENQSGTAKSASVPAQNTNDSALPQATSPQSTSSQENSTQATSTQSEAPLVVPSSTINSTAGGAQTFGQFLNLTATFKQALASASQLEVQTNERQSEILKLIASAQVAYSICGLVIGSAFMVAGAVLALGGLSGYFAWLTDSFGATSYVLNAVPGLIMFVAGISTVWFTRFTICTRSN